MIVGVRIAIFTEIKDLVEELIAFLPIFGPRSLPCAFNALFPLALA